MNQHFKLYKNLNKIIFLMFLLAFCLISACRDPKTQYEILLRQNKLQTDASSGTNMEEWREMLAPACVRVHGGGVHGSGVILYMDKEQLLIGTTMHFLQMTHTPQVTFFDGKKVTGQAVYGSNEYDIGVIRIALEAVGYKSAAGYRYLEMNQENYAACEEGDSMFLLGSIDTVADRLFSGTVSDTWYRTKEFQGNLLLSSCEAVAGMSGCGTFDERGNFLGILVGGDLHKRSVSLPVGMVYEACMNALMEES